MSLFVCVFFSCFSSIQYERSDADEYTDLFALKFKPNQGQTSDPSWVLDALKYIKSTGARKPLILTSFDHFVIAYYTDYKVDLLWPLKKGIH